MLTATAFVWLGARRSSRPFRPRKWSPE